MVRIKLTAPSHADMSSQEGLEEWEGEKRGQEVRVRAYPAKRGWAKSYKHLL